MSYRAGHAWALCDLCDLELFGGKVVSMWIAPPTEAHWCTTCAPVLVDLLREYGFLKFHPTEQPVAPPEAGK